ncbi:MAG TPA: hypothetical protein VJ978_15495 [Nitriliruptoraceae bacterium]|nr:hypothetical protein [Nitriliruptoraceae bacterium]
MNAVQRGLVEQLLGSSPVLGAEVDIRYRVLAVTVEPSAADHPVDPAPADRRLQVVVHPVGSIAAALVDHADPTAPTILHFDETQLADVFNAFADAVSTATAFDDAMPDVDVLGDRLSMFGSAQTGDGTATTLHLHLDEPGGTLTLDLWASFDELEVRDADGQVIA